MPPQDRHPLVYKIATASQWDAAVARGAYDGSADDRRDGYIHLSTAGQLAGTLAKHFRGQAALHLIAFNAAALGPALQWETSRGGDLFPHLYATLDPRLALWQRPIPIGRDGVPTVPEDIV